MFPEPILADAARTPAAYGQFIDFTRMDDFGTVAAGTTADGGGGLIFTAVAAGTLTRPTQRGGGGWARLSGAATTDNSGANAQMRDFCSLAVAGKTMTFKTRFILNEATSTNNASASIWVAGLAPIDTALNHATSGAADIADGFYIVKAGDATAIAAVMAIGSVLTSTTMTTIESKAMTTIGISVEITSISSTTPTGNVFFHLNGGTGNGGETVRLTAVTLPATTVFLAPSINFQTTDNTGTKFMDLDYIGGWQLR